MQKSQGQGPGQGPLNKLSKVRLFTHSPNLQRLQYPKKWTDIFVVFTCRTNGSQLANDTLSI